MFKHLTRIATANQLRASTSLVSSCALQTQARLASAAMRCQQIVVYNQQYQHFSTSSKKRDLSSLVPDYATLNSELFADTVFQQVTPQQLQDKHPADISVEHSRKSLQYTLKQNEFYLFNMPPSVTEESIRELCSEKGIQIMGLTLSSALNTTTARLAHAKVTVGSPQQVKALKDKFKNVWVEDKKIKLKTREEIGYESFDHRSIIVQGFPSHYKAQQLIKLFGEFGSLVNIELPTRNLQIEQELKNKMDATVKERKDKQALDTRRAQAVVRESVRENEHYYRQLLSDVVGQEQADKLVLQIGSDPVAAESQIQSALTSKRNFSIQSMLFQLQSESVQVSKARTVLLSLRDHAQEEVPALNSAQDLIQQVQDNQGVITDAVKYLQRNRDNIDETTLDKLNQKLLIDKTGSTVDPIEKLIKLSRTELASAYDSLISALSQRTVLIEDRIKAQVTHLGIEERILFENKDWAKETEDLKPFDYEFGGSTLRADQIIPLNEQVDNVLSLRNMTPETRFAKLIQKKYNPFLQANFNDDQLKISNSEEMTNSDIRIPARGLDPNKAPTVNKLLFEGYRFTEDTIEELHAHIQDLRDNFDLPFDELYQKEKKLVDAVIKATDALRNKEAALLSPISPDRLFSSAELTGNYIGDKYQKEDRFTRDQKAKNDKILSEQIDSTGAPSYNFSLNHTTSLLDQYLADGTLSKQDYDDLASFSDLAQEANFGYAFLTYSHSDEAKLAIIIANGMIADNLELEITNKSKDVDHHTFDQSYTVNKLRNQSKLTEELKGLRESRKELRDFEGQIDSELPSMRKMRKFRGMGKDLVDGERSHVDALRQRTQYEEEKVMDKIRKLQKENPDRDYTQLFETERAELARKNQHKKAFASYKAFQFLKHGVELKSRSAIKPVQSDQPAAYQVNDPYEFPLVQETVSTLMPKGDLYPRIMDGGDRLDDKAGRKFGYTDDDFLRAYFGKDYARNAQVHQDDSNLYQLNESLTRRYPMDKYIMTPHLEAQKQLLEDRAQVEDSPLLDKYIDTLDVENSIKWVDAAHPSGDKNRSLLKDANRRMENYLKRKEKNVHPDVINTKELAYIKRGIRDEYFPKPKAPELVAADDTKQEEKFEPHFEGGSAPATTDDGAKQAAPKKEYRPRDGRQQQRRVQEHRSAPSSDPVGPKKNALLEEMENDPFNHSKESFEFDKNAQIQNDQKQLNREFLYEYKYRKEHGTQALPGTLTQRIERFAAMKGITTEQAMEELKDLTSITDSQFLDGPFAQKDKYGKESQEVQGRQKAVRSIDDFAGSAANEDLSEREDEDIYRHYIEQMRKEKEQQSKAPKTATNKAAQEQAIKNLQDLHPEMPRFEGFFRSTAEGKHPFDELAESTEQQDAQHLKEEEAFDEELYQRELKGRLLGETLSPKQFALLYDAKIDHNSQVRYLKDQDRKEFIDNRDMVRLADEAKEGARRRVVMQGKVDEEDSQAYIRKEEIKFAEMENNHAKERDQQIRSFHQERQFLQLIMGDEEGMKRRLEKEYYFDENLGESLKDHVEDLKGRFPELDVQVRRDRDGYAVVKTQFTPKYKYDLDKALQFDAEDASVKVKESLEDLHRTVIGADSVNSLDREQLEKKLGMLLQKGNDNRYELDTQSKDAISELWKERTQGKYKNDREGFTKAFLTLQTTAKLDKSKKSGLFEDMTSQKDFIRELAQERDQMAYEIALQVTSRVKSHLFMKERTHQDIAQPHRSETSLFGNQVQSQTNALKGLDKHAAELAGQQEKDESFDKEAYQRIKAEIKQRREAKERLLQQGFPELKPYISI